MVAPTLMPVAGQQQQQQAQSQEGLLHVLEQLERHCLAPDASLVTKSVYYDLLLAREEMGRERLRYLEVMAVYSEAITLVEEYQQAISVANSGGNFDLQAVLPQFGLRCAPQVYEALEQHLIISEASQRLRLPLISKDGDIPEEDTKKWSIVSRSSLDSTSTSTSIISSIITSASSGANAASNTTSTSNTAGVNGGDVAEFGIGGVVDRFLGNTPNLLRQTHLTRNPIAEENKTYVTALISEIESHMKTKCEQLNAAFQADEIDGKGPLQLKRARLPERIKLAVEVIELEESALLEDLYSIDRKFSEYYNVLEQILAVLLKLVKDCKLQHQHQYDEIRKAWLCKRCETMNAKLRVLEHLLLRDTYTQEAIPALHIIRNHLFEANKEAAAAYNRAVTRLREYQGVDQYFDDIAGRYHDIVKKLEGIQWTIRQVEMDLNNDIDNFP
ncbi:hypothetical protein O6H91_10G062100 [Diphasiastrum complanatum]|uniref:Uncharacterized protein n=1 Tax=Diphasiastrum complanatum TaxID=34168 RepID=A0ACC2CHQ3_DIPCM|nr:hypothetical protein O6H91_10G062100 [Diphasiastrum complanatum]